MSQNPILFEANRVWRSYLGGALLDRMENKDNPVDTHYPEDWIGSTTLAKNPGAVDPDEGLSVCNIGGDRRLFRDLLAENPEFYLGEHHTRTVGAELGILVKYLDSAVRLHIQAHPTAAFARKYLNTTYGKAEAYYILSVRPGADAHVLLGFQRPPGREELRDWIVNQRLTRLRRAFDPIAVKPGDCLFIPGGVPHAIGPGICLVELMEPSDWVVRCEFEHNGYTLPESARYLKGSLDLSIDCFDLTSRTISEVRREFFPEPRLAVELGPSVRVETLIDNDQTRAFRMRRIVSAQEPFVLPGGEGFIGLVIEGDAKIGELDCCAGSRLFFPAGISSWTINPGLQGLTLLQCLPPCQP